MRLSRLQWLRAAAMATLTSTLAPAALSANPTAADALKLEPTQSDVEYDRPAAADIAKCSMKAETIDGHTGWVVRDESNRILRRFIDSNNDNVVDMWCYYQNGIEVYRDVDLNFNGKADQFRWLNTSGSRWGVDNNDDGKLDSWKVISAEEATAELVRAVGTRDSARFGRLLLTEAELTNLGLGAEQTQTLKTQLQGAPERFKTLLANQKSSVTKLTALGNKLKWVHFAGSQPGLVPAGTQGSTKDIVAYENVATMVQADEKHEQLLVGTIVRVGDVWRLIDAPPTPSEGQELAAGPGFFFPSDAASARPDVPSTGGAGGVQDAKLQELMAQVEKIDDLLTKSNIVDKPKLHAQRADVVEEVARLSSGDDRKMWIKQLAETLSASAQMNEFPEGVNRLEALVKKLGAAQPADADLTAYAEYRYLTADYGYHISQPNVDFVKVQQKWNDGLAAFIDKYPKCEDAPEAIFQLAIIKEYADQEEEAKKLYGRVAADFADTSTAKKAAGAKARLESVGKVIQLTGKGLSGSQVSLANYRNKSVVVLHYWASDNATCVAELETLKQLQAKYGKELTILSISLDGDKQKLVDFLKAHKVTWTQIWEPGGMDSPLANALGILQLPSMMLIDKTGKVVNRAAIASQLDKDVGALLR